MLGKIASAAAVLVLGLLSFAAPSQARARHRPYTVIVHPIEQAMDRARAYWASQGYDSNAPCSGHVSVTEAMLPDDRPAQSTYTMIRGSRSARWWDCSITFNTSWWNRRVTPGDWPDLCVVAIHELGHYITEIDESADPTSVMFLYADASVAPPICGERIAVRGYGAR